MRLLCGQLFCGRQEQTIRKITEKEYFEAYTMGNYAIARTMLEDKVRVWLLPTIGRLRQK